MVAAAQNGHVAVVQELLAPHNAVHNIEVNKARTTDGATPLLLAAQNGHVAVVQELLAPHNAVHNIEVNKATNNGCTPLIIASHRGYVEIVNALLAKNADVNATTNDGTALFFASSLGQLNVVKALLAARNIEVNKVTPTKGATPLFSASLLGHADVIKELLSQKAEIEKTDNNGCTPLLVATQNGHLEAVQTLLQAGANQDISTNGDYQFGYNVILSNDKIRIQVTKDASSCLYSSLTPLDCATEIYNQLETLLKAVAEADPHFQTFKNKLNDYSQIIRLLSQHALLKKKVRNADDADLKSHSPKRAASGSDSPVPAAAAALILKEKHPSPDNSPTWTV